MHGTKGWEGYGNYPLRTGLLEGSGTILSHNNDPLWNLVTFESAQRGL